MGKVVPFRPRRPVRWYCSACGAERPADAGEPPACRACGSTSWQTWRPTSGGHAAVEYVSGPDGFFGVRLRP